MLIGFIGSPASGKTTIATKMFSSFKEVGTKCELIVEQARQYIAEKRFNGKLLPNDKILLEDFEQKEIAERQFKVENIMKYSCGPTTVIVSDSCTLNAGLYMSDQLYNQLMEGDFFYTLAKNYDLLFFCHPINFKSLPDDPNRVHNLDEINQIHNRSMDLLNKLKSRGIVPIHELLGTMKLENRYNEASSITLSKHCELIQRL